MPEYWHTRYLDTLSKVDAATNARVRSAYLDLAEHYRAMAQFSERSPAFMKYGSAA
jgi:hypothetical protein